MGFFARLVVAIENVIGRIFPALKRPRKWQRGNGTLPPASPNVPYPPAPPPPSPPADSPSEPPPPPAVAPPPPQVGDAPIDGNQSLRAGKANQPAAIEVPGTFAVERIENGYLASGPLESGWYINIGIEGDTVRSNAPYLKATDPNGTQDWPFEWTDKDHPNWAPAPPPIKWFITHSDYEPAIAAPIGGIKEIYQGSIDADGVTFVGETTVEVNTQEAEDARRAKNRKIRAQIKKARNQIERG